MLEFDCKASSLLDEVCMYEIGGAIGRMFCFQGELDNEV
jgi:hypothetical protein